MRPKQNKNNNDTNQEGRQIDVSIIIVGLNAKDYVIDCLRSLRKTEWGPYEAEIIYVDNGSQDGSVEAVETQFPEVILVSNLDNLGFCRAVNQGSDISRGRYLYHLNDDTIVFNNSVPLLIRFLDGNPHVGAVGNRLLNPDMSDQWSARRFPTWYNGLLGRRTFVGRLFPKSRIISSYLYKDEMKRGHPFEVDWIPGSCTMVRREIHKEVGGLPEDFHYWSDAVYCHRIRQKGYPIFLVPKARLVHYEGKGSGKRTSKAERWHIREFHNSAFRFYCEYHQFGPRSLIRTGSYLALRLREQLLLAFNRLS